jgi:hypothetical protein
VALAAEAGDVLQTRQAISSGGAGAMAVTTTYSDYREVGWRAAGETTITS